METPAHAGRTWKAQMDAIDLIREARRAGVRLYYDLEAKTSKMVQGTLTAENRPVVDRLLQDAQSVSMRLRWEANERAAMQRPCPTCDGIDWVDSRNPGLTVRPGGGQLMESWTCEACGYDTPYRRHHGAWSSCHWCGATTGSAPDTWTRYICGTCLVLASVAQSDDGGHAGHVPTPPLTLR